MKIPRNFYKTIIKAKRVTNRVLPAASERRLHYFSDFIILRKLLLTVIFVVGEKVHNKAINFVQCKHLPIRLLNGHGNL